MMKKVGLEIEVKTNWCCVQEVQETQRIEGYEVSDKERVRQVSSEMIYE